MKIPKYSCSVCRKPSSRKWNLYRHISNCHSGIGNCVPNWDFPVDTFGPGWNRWEKGAINQKESSHYIRPDLLKHFLSNNESNDRKPFDYQQLFKEVFFKELVKKAVSTIQPTQSRISFPFYPMNSSMPSPLRNYNVHPAANLQIFGFRGYVCDKCLTPETHYVAFPNAEGDGRIESSHFCLSAKAESVDRSGVFRSLYDKIPTLLKQKVNSRTWNNNHLVALRLSSPHEEIIKLPNPVYPSKPGIAFQYSKQRHLSLKPAKEKNKNKCDYLTRAVALGMTALSDEELTDFLEHMRNTTFGTVTGHDNNTQKDDLSQDSLSYFVFLYIN
jgi:hypothetical protein